METLQINGENIQDYKLKSRNDRIDRMTKNYGIEFGRILTNIESKSAYYLNLWCESTLRLLVNPPLKGEITKGKLKIRGLRLCVQTNGMGIKYYWIEQRGVKVGKKFFMKIEDGYLNYGTEEFN